MTLLLACTLLSLPSHKLHQTQHLYHPNINTVSISLTSFLRMENVMIYDKINYQSSLEE